MTNSAAPIMEYLSGKSDLAIINPVVCGCKVSSSLACMIVSARGGSTKENGACTGHELDSFSLLYT